MNKVKEGTPGILIMWKGTEGEKTTQNMICLSELQVISVLLDEKG